MKKIKIFAAVLAVIMACSTILMALLPVQPIQAAKKNYITKAQAVAAINRKLGIGSYSVKKMAQVTDCKPKDKSYKIMAKAVSAGLISPNSKGRLYPNKKADYQYVASIFAKIRCTKMNKVLKGYNKTTKLTSKYFRKYLSESFSTTVTKSKSKVKAGNVIINRPGVILKNCTVSQDLIIADGVGKKGTVLKRVSVNGNTIFRGGGYLTLKNGSELSDVNISKNLKKPVLSITSSAKVSTIKVNAVGTKIKSEGKIDFVEVNVSNVSITDKNMAVSQVKLAAGVMNVYLNGKLIQEYGEDSQMHMPDFNSLHFHSVYINKTRTKVYAYLTKALDEKSVPSANAFTAVRNGKTIMAAHSIKLANVDDRGTFLYSYVELVFDNPLPEENTGDLYLYYHKPEENPMRSTEENVPEMDSVEEQQEIKGYASNQINPVQASISAIYYSKAELGGYYVSVQFEGVRVWESMADYVISADGTELLALEGISRWIDGYSTVSFGIMEKLPSTMILSSRNGNKIKDVAFNEYDNISASSDRLKEIKDLTIQSAEYDLKQKELIITHSTEAMSGANGYLVQTNGKEVQIHGGAYFNTSNDGGVGGVDGCKLSISELNAYGISEDDLKNGAKIKFNGSLENENGLFNLSGFSNLSGKPAVSEYVSISIPKS